MRGSNGSVVALALASLWMCAILGSWKAAFAPYAKNPKNAYMHFSAEKRQFYADQGKSIGEVGKALGADWAAMSAAEKAKYQDMAKADKERYENDLKTGLEPKPRKSRSGAKQASKKDGPKPKRAPSAYILFVKEQHAKFAAAGATGTAAEKMKEIAATWKDMSDAEKQPFVDEAAQEKERLAQEKEAAKGPKRPRNAYIFFAQEQYAKFMEAGTTAAEKAKEIAAIWRGMSDAERQPFVDKAAKDKERYELETS